jgi:hypothetical protein
MEISMAQQESKVPSNASDPAETTIKKKFSGNIWCVVHEESNGETWELISEYPYIAVCAETEQEAKEYFLEVYNELVDLGEDNLKMPIKEQLYLRLMYIAYRLSIFSNNKPFKNKKGYAKWRESNLQSA